MIPVIFIAVLVMMSLISTELLSTKMTTVPKIAISKFLWKLSGDLLGTLHLFALKSHECTEVLKYFIV